MQRPRDGVVEVELVEDDGATGTAGVVRDLSDAGPSLPSLRSTVRDLPRGFWAAVVVALALGGTGVAVGQAEVDRALDARLARVAGLTGSLAQPLQEAWRVPGSGVIATTADVVVHHAAEGQGAIGTSLGDGTMRYRVPGMCRLAPTEGDSADLLVEPPGGRARPGDVLVCVRFGAGGMVGPVSTGTEVGVVDPATGRTLRTIAIMGANWHVVGGDLVSIGLDADRRVAAGRWSLATGEPRWLYHGTTPAPGTPDAWGTATGDGTIGLELEGWSVTLDVETGAELAPSGGDVAPFVGRIELRDGGSLVYGPSGGGGIRSTLHPADGGAPVTVPGLMLAPAVDDGSVPDAAAVLDLEGGGGHGLSLVDLGTGAPRWTVGLQGEVGFLSGLVLVAGGDRTTVVDARTGEVRWESTSDSAPFGWGLASDGRRVLVVEGSGTDRELVARDLRSGDRLWSSQQPVSGGMLVPLPDGTVLAAGTFELVALRPPTSGTVAGREG